MSLLSRVYVARGQKDVKANQVFLNSNTSILFICILLVHYILQCFDTVDWLT